MNGKKAKNLRRKAKEIMYDFVCARVLSDDLTSEADYGTIIGTLPERIHMKVLGSIRNGVGTKRFFIRYVKKNPNATYAEIDEEVYGNATK